MGGCRCTFGDCNNSTTNTPGMHFFHFPYKDAERCKKWALYSGRKDFLKLPHSQLRNKTICGNHFAEKCFMNYLKESLNRNAVPTLQMDWTNGKMTEVQVDLNELTKLVYPAESKQQTIDLPETMTSSSTQPYDDIDSISSMSFDDSDATECEKPIVLNRAVKRNAIADGSAPAGHLFSTYGSAKRVASEKMTERKSIPLPQPSCPLTDKFILKPTKRMVLPRKPTQNVINRMSSRIGQQEKTTPIQQNVSNSPNTDDIVDAMIDPDANASFNSEPIPIPIPIKTEVATTATIDKELYLRTVAEHTKQIEELKKMLAEKLQDERTTSQQSASVSASSSSDVRGEMKIAKGPAMTKIQLFNGIRKYLNPSMVALLRMEIFGGAEREYRSDEKQIAKELFNLNATVYDYMREEWRFRLPAKAQVEAWLKEPDDEDTSEFF